MHLPDETILHNIKTNQQYKITGNIRPGGFGLTYLGERITYNNLLEDGSSLVVIKELFFKNSCKRDLETGRVIPYDYAKEVFESSKKALINEAKIQHDLLHPNIVKVQDVFEANNTVYSVMEHVEGKDLDLLITDKKKLPYSEVLRYARQIGEALNYIHTNYIIHYDIKPSNILINRDNNIKIIDFGMARRYGDKGTAEQTKLLKGESGIYTAPEVLAGDTIGFKPCIDIYSLGVTLFYALTGEKIPGAITRSIMSDATL